LEWNCGTSSNSISVSLYVYRKFRRYVVRTWERILALTNQELYESFLHPLEDAVLEDGTLEARLALLTFYTHLLQHWSQSLLSQNQPSLQPSLTIGPLTDHVNILALTIVQLSLSVSTCSTVLDFYETSTDLLLHPELRATVRIITPPAELVYTIFLTQSLSTQSRLCAVLAKYKRAFEPLVAPNVVDQQAYPKDYVNHFNGFLMDLCNCLWRSRAFNTSDVNSLGCLIPEPVTAALTKYVTSLGMGLDMAALFSLSYSPAISMQAISYLRELEDAAEGEISIRQAGPVTQASLRSLQRDGGINMSWRDYRLGVLQYLEGNGAPGVGQLMYNTIKNLMT